VEQVLYHVTWTSTLHLFRGLNVIADIESDGFALFFVILLVLLIFFFLLLSYFDRLCFFRQAIVVSNPVAREH
jgi:hypothetical protein